MISPLHDDKDGYRVSKSSMCFCNLPFKKKSPFLWFVGVYKELFLRNKRAIGLYPTAVETLIILKICCVELNTDTLNINPFHFLIKVNQLTTVRYL